MKMRLLSFLGIVLLVCLGLQACGGTTPVAPATVPPAPPATQAQAAPLPTQPPAAAVPTDTAVPAPPTSAPPAVKHTTIPTLSFYMDTEKAIDCVDAVVLKNNVPSGINTLCENPKAQIIERPFSSDLKSYFPYLDIAWAQFGSTKDWIYTRIVVANEKIGSGTGDVYYFVKVDFSLDKKSDNMLIYSVKNLPADAQDWTTNGVQAWSYVGTTLKPIFDQGVGADPDAVWARRLGQEIDFAVKPSLLNNSTQFGWSAWAYQGTMAPTDLATAVPAATVFSLDNTCVRGFNSELNLFPNACK